MRFPAKSFRIDFPERTLRKYEVTLTGLKGYGINYGVIESITSQSEECDEEHLGQTVLDLLEKSRIMGRFNYTCNTIMNNASIRIKISNK